MSQENVDLVKKLVAPAGTDYRTLFGDNAVYAAAKAAVEPIISPDFEGAFFTLGSSPTTFTGLDGLREAFLDWIAPWATYYDEIEEVFSVGDDRVVVFGREHGHRLDTESAVVAESAGVYTVRDGRIARVEYYAQRAEALKAVGLSEDRAADSSRPR